MFHAGMTVMLYGSVMATVVSVSTNGKRLQVAKAGCPLTWTSASNASVAS